MKFVLKDIQKSFPEGNDAIRDVLCGVNLSLEQGDFVAITGVSGSGKSTLLNILGTLMLPDKGSYFIDGKEIFQDKEPLETYRNKHIGLVFQDFRLLPQYTAFENILVPILANCNSVSEEDCQYALSLMETLNIKQIKDHLPEKMSGGEKARTAICRALINRPSLILADEPTGQLDRSNAETIVKLLQEVNHTFGTTIVMVTHDDNIAAKAKKVLHLINGELQ